MSTRRGIAVWSLVVLAALLAIISSLTVWTKRQLLDTDQWTKTSAQVLADPQVRTALSNQLVDQLYQSVDVTAALKQQLPEAAQGAAPAIAAAIRTGAVRTTDALLATPRAQQLWENINRRAHGAIVNVLEGKPVGPVSTDNGAVVLDVKPLLNRLADRLGVGDRLRARAKPGAGEIVLLRSDQLNTAQTAVQIVRVLSVFFAFIVLALLAAAIYLARNRRRIVLEGAGVSLVVAGLILLIVRRAAGNAIVDSLVQTQANRPPVHAIWVIETAMLRDIALGLVVYGVFAILAGWLAGPARAARWIRRSLAPTFAQRPVVVYLVALVVFLVLIAWGPFGDSRRLIGVVTLAVLAGVGLEVWRRQSIREFGPASTGTPEYEEGKPALT
jgi:hypothetical protein